MMKHLFHGTRATAPKQIYSTEDGLDIRFSNSGMYGQGVYFADNSMYSHTYSHPMAGGKGEMQMFLALVLVGDSVYQPPGQYRIPPNKKGSTTERYDSINNGGGGHYIIYDNVKSYPAYLITYK
jgi:poly [ADP-ribose] polymerase 10/14/15